MLLAAAGRRAANRADIPATINLLERAVELLPEADPEAVALYPDLASVIEESGDLQRAEPLYRTAEELGDEATALRARLRRIWLEASRGAGVAATVAPIEAVVAEAERRGDEAIVAESLLRLAALKSWLGDEEQSEQLLRRSLACAEVVGDPRLRSEATHWLGLTLLWGPTPVPAALDETRSLAESTGIEQTARTELLVVQGTLLALTGEFALARRLVADGRRALLDYGLRVSYAATSQPAAMIELLAGDAAAAEHLLREAHEILEAAGERGYLSSVSGLLALALVRQERYTDAEPFADESRRVGAEDDLVTQIFWRVAKAQIAGARKELAEAARLATEVTELIASYDGFDGPLAMLEVAPFLEPEAAKGGLERALVGAEAKGNVVMVERVRAELAALP
jgi:tetratricopeptide (TPR) repeat protein